MKTKEDKSSEGSRVRESILHAAHHPASLAKESICLSAWLVITINTHHYLQHSSRTLTVCYIVSTVYRWIYFVLQAPLRTTSYHYTHFYRWKKIKTQKVGEIFTTFYSLVRFCTHTFKCLKIKINLQLALLKSMEFCTST